MRRSLLVSVALALSGCFYGFSGGGLPSHIHTVAIIPFDNRTANPELQRELAETLRDKLRDKLGLRDATEARANAIVRGTIQRYEADIPVGSSANNKQATSAKRQLQITVDIEMVDQVTGKTLFTRKGLAETADYDERAETTGRRQAMEQIVNQIVQGAQSQW
ncbi:MAG TPA: LPS assembly lipoprotein LptE [Gemmatimonadaceae bacterium]|nr:LPS assembly lipoprotein LptE [Gemmatimonadaceae bacterium]